MSKERVLQALDEDRFVIIMRSVPIEKIGKAAETLVSAGVHLAEVTFDQTSGMQENDFKNAVCRIREAVGDNLILGAGTVMTERQVEIACENGAEFIVSPNVDREVIEKTRKLELVSIPGGLTPTEVAAAWKYGADIVKFFPASAMGIKYVKSLCEPISHIPLLGTGGCNEETIPDYWRAGIHYFGTGLATNKVIMEADNYSEMYRLSKAHLESIRKVRAEVCQ